MFEVGWNEFKVHSGIPRPIYYSQVPRTQKTRELLKLHEHGNGNSLDRSLPRFLCFDQDMVVNVHHVIHDRHKIVTCLPTYSTTVQRVKLYTTM